jgi:copper chaperone CopZ
MPTTQLKIDGMHCNSCKLLIEDVCRDYKNVQTCDVNLDSGLATIVHDGELDLAKLITEIESLDRYKVSIL